MLRWGRFFCLVVLCSGLGFVADRVVLVDADGNRLGEDVSHNFQCPRCHHGLAVLISRRAKLYRCYECRTDFSMR